MQSIAIVILGIIGMLLGWFVYSKFIASRIFKLDDSFVTPAHTMKDGVDYVPTNKVVLWGHHFTSVAGAAPIVGPAIAVYWGWVPAVLWVVFGTILFAGVHDMGALWASARHKATPLHRRPLPASAQRQGRRSQRLQRQEHENGRLLMFVKSSSGLHHEQ